MFLTMIKAALLSGSTAATLLILPMHASAANSFLNEPAAVAKIARSDAQETPRGRTNRLPLLGGIGASCLLAAACYLLALGMVREHRSKKRDEQRIAVALSKAVHDGVAEFGVEHSNVSFSLWVENEEDEHAPNSLILSRYRMLGYSGELRERTTACEDLPTRTIIYGNPYDIVSDQELLLGISRSVLKPEMLPFPSSVANTSSLTEGHPNLASISNQL